MKNNKQVLSMPPHQFLIWFYNKIFKGIQMKLNLTTTNTIVASSSPSNPNWPSRTGNPSGPGRGNAPSKGK